MKTRSIGRTRRRVAVAVASLAALSLLSGGAQARRRGIISADCIGCHGEEASATVEMTASPAGFGPGDDVTFTVTVRRMQGTAAVGGVSISQPPIGELYAIAGEGLTLVTDSGLTHSQPKTAVSGVVTFRFGWRAPAEPGGVAFQVGAVAGNGDGRQTGDATGVTRFLSAFGCEPAILYADQDRDAHGTELFDESIGCLGGTVPDGFATVADDCNDNDATVFPTALEKCNKKDDDCDGETDEDAELVTLWPDQDGDGYYQFQTGTSVVGCVGLQGYAAEPGDCAPSDPAVNPGATEICNLIDDNCDGRPDDRLRPQCGIGRCRRESYDCDAAHCTPGEPTPERCNFLDDDCNDEIDEGDDLCPVGSACLAGRCVVTEGVAGTAGASSAGTGSTGAGAGGLPSSGGVGGGTAGGAASGAAPGAGGVTMPAAGGSTSGATGSGATANAGVGSASELPTTQLGSGCAIGERHSRSGGLIAMLLVLAVAWVRARRREAVGRGRRG